MFLYKIGGVLLNNTDNILISTLVGTITVGFYSNYSMIVQRQILIRLQECFSQVSMLGLKFKC